MSKRGIFISLEGCDGSGKSTQLENIKKFFREEKIDALYTREPGGTFIGEKIRKIILDIENEGMSPRAEALLYAASRAQHVDQVILPALNEGRIILCDRYADSSIAYQAYGRELGQGVVDINRFATKALLPDVTIFLDLPPDEGKARMDGNKKDLDRLEVEENDFHHRVYKGYKDIIKENSNRFIVIDARGTIEEVEKEIVKALKKVLGDFYAE